MAQESLLFFADLQIDVANECVWRGKHALKLTPTAFAFLRHLMAHAGQLVTKAELLAALWPETAVTEGVLTTHVRQLRQVLGDDPTAPRFIETVHRRGYRFLPTVTAQPVPSSKFQVPSSDTQPSGLSTRHSILVGRETELSQLHGWLEKALQGERQIVFVTGEPGIGKTTLVEAFLQSLAGERQEENQQLKGKKQKAKRETDPRPLIPDPWISWGQCIEHYGTGEPYLPILEALGRLCRAPDGRQLIDLLAQQAPTWLVQIPVLLNAAELEALQRKTAGATRERMLRELAEAMEALTAERPVVLWFEDLHWSDVSTLDWLALLARRRERARLLLLGTYRPVEVIVREHPLRAVKHELQLHGQCGELPLRFLRKAEVAEYLAIRFSIPSPLGGEGQDGGTGQRRLKQQPPHPGPLPLRERGPKDEVVVQKLAQLIHQRTDGNPLFMVTVVKELVTQGGIVQREGQWELSGRLADVAAQAPESLQQLIAHQVERLTPKGRRMLEVASVAGAEFSAAAVAAGVGATVEEVEEECGELARREHFLRASGLSEWPDGTIAARYSFLHALYQEVLYERLPVGRRQRLHQQIGEREEHAYGERAREIAAELAVHFERGREYRKAVRYLRQAGENATRRSAHQEAISLFTKGLELLKTLPDTPERAQQELRLQVALASSLQAIKGFAAAALERVCARVQELCRQVEEIPLRLRALTQLGTFYIARAEYQMVYEIGEQLLHLAQTRQDPTIQMGAHMTLGMASLWLGELLSARTHLEQTLALHDLHQPRSVLTPIFPDRKVAFLPYLAFLLEVLGYPDQARQRNHEAFTLAQGLTHPFSLAYVLIWTTYLHQVREEGSLVQEQAGALIALSHEQGFAQMVATGLLMRGWALTEQGQAEEGLAQIRQGLTARQATGAANMQSHFLALLAEAYGKAGQLEAGLTVLVEALAFVDKTRERYYEAELYRLKGELLLTQEGCRPQAIGHREKTEKAKKGLRLQTVDYRAKTAEAEACFLKAIEIARKQQAKSWELRATMSLARLGRQQGKKEEARQMLAEIYNWFTEGFDTADLKEARMLLEELT